MAIFYKWLFIKNLLEQTYNREITPYIFAVTKESPPDIAGISIYPGRFDFELRLLEQELPHILRVKNGEEAPKMCGNVNTVANIKSLTGFLEVGDLLE